MVPPLTLGLSVATEDLYRVFARYSLAPRVEGCPCCVTEEDHALIHAFPLRELPADNLDKFAFKALSTWGSIPDLKHFLPRLFELLTEDAFLVDHEVLVRKLPYANWRTWPDDEQAAIERWLREYWLFTLGEEPFAAQTMGGELCAIAQAVDDLTWYLRAWRSSRLPGAAVHLAHLVLDISHDGMKHRRLCNPFWDHRPLQMRQVIAWIEEPATIELLRKALCEELDEENQYYLSKAIDALTSYS